MRAGGEEVNDELEQRLRDLGASEYPGPDPAFANRLETELRLGFDRKTTVKRPLWQPVVGLVSLFLLVGALVFGSGLGRRTQATELVMSSAESTTLVLPDGSQAVATDGWVLSEGTRIMVGSNGGAVIDDLFLPPGTAALIVGGQVEILNSDFGSRPSPDIGSRPSPDRGQDSSPDGATPTSTTALAPDQTDRRTEPVPTTVDSDRSSTTRVSPPTTIRGDQPTTSLGPATTLVGSTVDEVGQGPSTSTTAPVDPSATLEQVTVSQTRVRLVWTINTPGRVAGWVVLARADGPARTVAILRDHTSRELTIERPVEGNVSYWVVARLDSGEVLTESNQVQVSAVPNG